MKNTKKRLISYMLMLTLAISPISSLAQPSEAAAASTHQTVDGYSYPNEAVEVLGQINAYRSALGLPAVKLDPVLNEAAQNHSDYVVSNSSFGHIEEKGKPGFTGERATDRAIFVGGKPSSTEPRAYGVSEVISFTGGLSEGVLQLINLPFHREPFLDARNSVVGVGLTENALVLNFAGVYDPTKGDTASQSGFVYPYAEQTDVVPHMLTGENPNPLEGTKYTHPHEVGTIISLYVKPSEGFDKNKVTLIEDGGKEIELIVKKDTATYVLSEKMDHWYFIPPRLKDNTKYTVKTNIKEWSFTTGKSRVAGSKPTEPEKPTPTPTTREPLKPNHIYVSNTEQKSLDDLRTRTKFFNTTASSGYVNVLVNNNEIVTNPMAHIVNGNTFIPLRGVFEALGAEVEWESFTQQVIIRYMDKTVILQIGSKKARVLTAVSGGLPTTKEFDIPVAPFIKNGSTFIPLRFVAESIGGEVKWYQDDYTAAIIAGYNIK